MVVTELIRSITNIIIFSIIPILYYFFTKRKHSSFFTCFGLYKPIIKSKKTFIICIILFLAFFSVSSLLIDNITSDTAQFTAQQLEDKGFTALIPAIIFSFLRTGFAEELFFRGFLGKCFSRFLGFTIGNIIQAVIFGPLHGVMFISQFGFIKAFIVFSFTALVGLSLGYIDERLSHGSILPSWLLHGLANMYSSLNVMF
ncbi:MAG: CPBP family intramembrane metalloprotease [Clostridium sp.]|nr:CPBP family intramembrane metalloprotease [Clostridium sp.]